MLMSSPSSTTAGEWGRRAGSFDHPTSPPETSRRIEGAIAAIAHNLAQPLIRRARRAPLKLARRGATDFGPIWRVIAPWIVRRAAATASVERILGAQRLQSHIRVLPP